jgi:aspartyl-tRNA(Asn)/glutamyl-tRNA(Gln) amidotransferase subunit C
MTSNTPRIDVEMVKHVAFLVRLGLSEEQALEFSRQFSSIIDYFQMLNEVDTGATPSAAQTSGAQLRLRDDAVQASLPREEFMQNVPHRQDGYVRVPLVLGEE